MFTEALANAASSFKAKSKAKGKKVPTQEFHNLNQKTTMTSPTRVLMTPSPARMKNDTANRRTLGQIFV